MNTAVIVIDGVVKIIFLLILLFFALTMTGVRNKEGKNPKPSGNRPEHPDRPKKKKDSNKE